MVVHLLKLLVLLILTTLCFCGALGAKMSSSNKQMALMRSTFYQTYGGDTTICRTVPGLTKSQIELCYQQPDVIAVALQGLNLAVKECQYQFQNHRWNCSSLLTRAKNPYTSALLQKGFKETAFSYAVCAAGVAISVAKACSQGTLINCGCDSKKYKVKGKRWKWGGCSHNLQYGMRFSKMFLDSREKAEDFHSKINLHNNQVGRMAVAANMQVKCKCHGMSGSCELKTCWRAVPDFRIVGQTLKEKFDSALLVDQTNLGNRKLKKFKIINERNQNQRSKVKHWLPPKRKHKRDLAYDLLYYEKSPNFCEKNLSVDVLGTSGRFCNKTSTGPNECSSLCCGRGYNLIREKRTERCKCKFQWCCSVECQICNIEKWISVCK